MEEGGDWREFKGRMGCFGELPMRVLLREA